MKYLPVVFLLASLPGFAQDSAQYRACNEKAKVQMEMNACASEEAARVDAELNDVYHKLLSQAGSQEEAVAKIKTAERAWIAYRDAYSDAMYPAKNKQAEYGSIYPMEADLIRAKLTQQQVTALKELLQQYGGAEHPGSNDTLSPKTGDLHLSAPAVAPSKPKH
jgi:uncharacterized protein YecT (DUF1311 family)